MGVLAAGAQPLSSEGGETISGCVQEKDVCPVGGLADSAGWGVLKVKVEDLSFLVQR